MLMRRWAPLSIATVLIVGLSVGLAVEASQAQSLRIRLGAGDAAAATQTSELASAKQEVQSLQSANTSLSGQVTSLSDQVTALKGQVATLTAQVANLNAQFPPPTSCTADPGFRANVNQISLQTVGLSTTQLLINYLCKNGITSPSAVTGFFNEESLNDLRSRFGYG
jgi:hypothetical protein